MQTPIFSNLPHRTHTWAWAVVCAALGVSWTVGMADDDMSDILQAAKPATTPATLTAPDSPENKPTTDALGTRAPKAPEGSRLGTITLNNGAKFEGRIWTTLATPLRVWIEATQSYRDIDLSLIQRVDVHVLAETMEDDWRWLKEGSDQKAYSGKKYPNVSLAYKFTLLNGQQVEGTVVAPIYFVDGAKSRTLALYKMYKGKVDETLKDLVYITAIQFDEAPANATQPKTTTKLPLLDD